MAHKKVHVTKGKRLPHGYKTIKAADRDAYYGNKSVRIDKGFRLPHGLETKSAANKSAYYEKGGKIKSLNAEIAEYEALISDSSIPQDEKDFAVSEIADLKEQIANLEKEKPTSAPKAPKAPTAKAPVSTQKPSYNCDELIQAEKDRRAARKKTAAEKASSPVKTIATKNKEAIEKVADKIENSLAKRLEKGEVSKSEINKLISETETLLKLLQTALKKV